MSKEKARHVIKRLLTFVLAVVLGLQFFVMPVQAASQSENLKLSIDSKDNESSESLNEIERIDEESKEESKETVTIIESKSDKVEIIESDTEKVEDDLEKETKEDSTKEIDNLEDQDQKLTKEQLDIAENMGLGETYIYKTFLII